MASNKRGIFLSIEGTDGSGKSTQIAKIISYLQKKGKDVVLTREPGGTPISEQIREMLLDTANAKMTPLTEMLLYAAAAAPLLRQSSQHLLHGRSGAISMICSGRVCFSGE